MALTTITVHGEILDPDGLTPAVGTVTFKNRVELRDTVDNIVYEPASWVATLDVNGEFTIVLPVTDNPDITPLDWTYQVYVSTTQWREAFNIELPAALGPVAEFADLIPLDDPDTCTPDGTACAPISLVGQVTELEADMASVEADIATLQGQMVTAQADIASLQATEGALVATVNIHTGQINTNIANIATLQGQMATVQANPGLTGPTAFVTVTPVHANITVATAVPPATRLERGSDAVRVRGFLQATGVVPAAAVLANIATVAHRPLHNVSTGVRYTAGSSRLQILTNGDITLGSALALNDQVWLDSVTFDLLA